MQGDVGTCKVLAYSFRQQGGLGRGPSSSPSCSFTLPRRASQALTLADVIKPAGLWPFLAAQIVLVWIWYALHAKRLRDAGKPVGVAVATCLLYVLSVVLLVIIAGAFYGALAGQGTDPNTASASA
jgi:hypothetical protein